MSQCHLSVKHLLEEMLKHPVHDLLGSSAIDLVDFFSIWVVGVETTELAFLVTKQQEKVSAITSVYDIEDSFASISVDHSWEDCILNGVQDDGTVGFGCWLTVQMSACQKERGYRSLDKVQNKKDQYLICIHMLRIQMWMKCLRLHHHSHCAAGTQAVTLDLKENKKHD